MPDNMQKNLSSIAGMVQPLELERWCGIWDLGSGIREFSTRHNSRTEPRIVFGFFAIASVWALDLHLLFLKWTAPTGGAVGAEKGGFSYILSIISASRPARVLKFFLNVCTWAGKFFQVQNLTPSSKIFPKFKI